MEIFTNDYWGTSMKKLGQIVLRALSREHRSKWNEIMSSHQDFISNLSNRNTFIDMRKKLSTEFHGPNAFKDQETDMDEEMKLFNDKKLCDVVEQYTTINENMKFLGEEGKSFTMRELNKQIKKMLTLQMRLEYVKLGGDTLNNKKVILAARDELSTYAKMNREIAELEQKQKNNNENASVKSDGSKGNCKGQQKGNNNDKSRELNPCKTHDGQHDWHNCPNNPCSKKFKGKMTAVKVTKPRPMVTRRRLSRESPTRKPTLFTSKLHSSQKQIQSIIMTL